MNENSQDTSTTHASDEAPVVAITGGASGIGFAVAQRWAAEGGRAVLLDLNPDGLKQACAELGEAARGVQTDVTDDASITAAYDSIAHIEGRLDAVVNCAGVSRPAPSDEISDTQFCSLIDIHINGSQRSSRAAYRLLSESPRAAIVNLSSVAAQTGMPQRAAYCAGKAGIEGLTRALAVEWARAGIRVNAVAPGYIRTALTDGLIEQGKLRVDRIVARTPMGRLGEPSEICEVIDFLLSPRASFITGQSIVADGGLTVDGDWY
ncbi:SDR family NAD(P)-dependent oxidoreductase [Pseudoclavibacter sp. CFCC 13611]|uniref:SDR family NAD(P)-dependent oxidoreductase n=1 Tax=Pseudoclavibacter sp. CFCC 13611 TaxID=2615178 RepID=UPI0013010DB8|nr:SDR family NAD(P)-dependent oxidoreductase [Pseudoclavibacter sp. CFCC 13611]KAB1664180.1 SDR family oxidoreductase [Pseudoclavibacter sp. CFCC 13611]